MNRILVYTKTGVILNAGIGFIFTGEMSGNNWQIDVPSTSGQKIHGITTQTTDEFTPVSAVFFVAGPQYCQLSSNVSVGDALSCDTNGHFFLKGALDSKVGIALTSGVSGGTAAVVITE